MILDSAKIAIIGLGFVGSAVRDSFDSMFLDAATVLIDSDPRKQCQGTYNDLTDVEAVFICVPSPQGPNGECDTGILENVLDNLEKVGYQNVIISKVTAVPKEYERLQKRFKNLVHIPEFLTAANATEEYRKETDAIIGGSVKAFQREAARIVKLSQPELTNIAFCSIGEAAMSKYVINSFLATKVVFMNEMYQLAQAHEYDWRKIRTLIDMDERIGKSHTRVPGPDGTLGFGGMCFPKDTVALLEYAKQQSVQLNVLDTAVKKNLLLRLTDQPK
jgi:UDPglucose 6-dehydrogenase